MFREVLCTDDNDLFQIEINKKNRQKIPVRFIIHHTKGVMRALEEKIPGYAFWVNKIQVCKVREAILLYKI